jgi:phage repressor protein C with HTH and peptisase S24 domain
MNANGPSFQEFYDRLASAGLIESQSGLAALLGVDRSAVTQAKRRDQIPEKWLSVLARKRDLSLAWLATGTLPMRLPASGPAGGAFSGPASKPGAAPRLNATRANFAAASSGMNGMDAMDAVIEYVRVPLAEARLSAGGGSFLTSAATSDSGFSFRRDWLARKGPPERLALMRVMGDSMEPELRDGDLALVDESPRQPRSGEVWAAALADSVVVKRLELRPGLVLLLSDNADYGPIVLQGDELDAVRLIGKVVWSCRDWL